MVEVFIWVGAFMRVGAFIWVEAPGLTAAPSGGEARSAKEAPGLNETRIRGVKPACAVALGLVEVLISVEDFIWVEAPLTVVLMCAASRSAVEAPGLNEMLI
ncbi:hypothetical protein ASF61_21950 [Duganella sp. Leaf126]|nr:hypothetical protein ASF61_21950 [Duganella sp. Leaf126]